jgi:KUP system potassium uptake protein
MSLGMVSVESSQNSIVSERSPQQSGLHVRFSVPNTGTVDDELQFLNDCRDAGVVHILGNTVVRARRESGLIKKIAVDYIYAFLQKDMQGK